MLSPAIGAICFGSVLIGLVVLAPLTPDVNLIGLSKIERSPQALTERAHTVLRNLGYSDSAADEAVGYTTDIDYLRYVDEHDRSPGRWRALGTSQPPSLLFWYRQSPQRLVPIGGTNIVTRQNPPDTRSGMASLTLDRTGRLVSFVAVPIQIDSSATNAGASAPAAAVDWEPLFEEAGLSIGRFSSSPPEWIPPIFADVRAAWEGVYPDRPAVPIRIESAALLGKPVYLKSWRRGPERGTSIFARTTRQASVSVSSCAAWAPRSRLRSPGCWPCATCVWAGAIAAARCG